MAFTFRASDWVSGASTTPTITQTNLGITVNDGDFAIVGVNANDDARRVTPDAGTGASWTEHLDANVTGKTASWAFYSKECNGSEPADFAKMDFGTFEQYMMFCMVFSGTGPYSIDAALNIVLTAGTSTGLDCEAWDGQAVSAGALSIIFGGKDGRASAEAYTTADNGFTGVIGGVNTGQVGAAAYKIHGSGETGSGSVTIDTADANDGVNDNTYSLHMSFVESGADTTAPVLTSPTAGSLTTDGVTPSVTTDEGNGTLYWGIYADAASPTASQVVAGTSAILSGSQAVSGTGSQAVSAQTGLDDATSYELFFVHDDAAANRSNLSTVGFTTSTDSTAPSLTSPTAGSVTSTSVAPTVTTDTAEGTAYARVYANGATPTASQVQSGTGVTPVASATNITVGASGALNFSTITGLTEGTDYELYFVHEDDATTPNLSAVSTVGFTTTAAARSVELTGANGYELRDETGAVIASLNGIIWEWYDDPDSTAGTPTDSGTFNTDANGQATITITGSSLANGAFGTLWVRHPTDDEIRGNYYLPITVS